jgi:predicted dehydrogenase
MRKSDTSVGIAIIGAKAHARAWIEAIAACRDLHVAGYWDPDARLAEDLARDVHDAPVFEDFHSLLQREDVLAAEVNLSPAEAVDVAGRCLEYGITVGLRSTSIRSYEDVRSLMARRKGKTAIRLFAPAFYYPPVDLARKTLQKTVLGDIQTMRIRSILGRSSRADDVIVGDWFDDAPDFCTPQYEALPLMYLLGDVRSVHVFENEGARVITWVSDRTPGGSRFGVYEAVKSSGLIVRGRLDPLDESYEIAGTDGYAFGGGLTGCCVQRPAFSTYIRSEYRAPMAEVDDDPMQSYRAAIADLADMARARTRKMDSINWMRLLGILRDALGLAVETGEEVMLEDVTPSDE